MRPALKAGLLPVWRDRDTVQIGIDPRRAIAISGMSETGFVIGLLDGSRSREQILAAATARGVPAEVTERILILLTAGGAIGETPATRLPGLPQPLPAGLASELATAELAGGYGDGGAGVLARRRAARVRVRGEPRIGRAIARLLVCASVGYVSRSASLDDEADGSGGSGRDGAGEVPGLAVLVGRPGPDLTWRLVIARRPYLAVSADEAIGVVGPLVIPGRTACLRCLDYARAQADPAWPLILAQVARADPGPSACDAVLAAAVAAQAAAQILTAIDREPAAAAAAGGTLELELPGWQWRRRTWARHPACPCARQVAR